MASSSEITLSGRIERITFHNQDNHFTIARFKTDESSGIITIKGTMPTPRVGKSVEVRGDWESHPRYGQQFKFNAFKELLPATVDGIRSYLKSGFIKGVGPKLVNRIIDHFNKEALTVIETDPKRLTEVSGIGKKTAQHIAQAWQSHHSARQLMDFLEKIGVDTTYAARLLREYGNEAIDILCNDPYCVAQDLPRIGFHIADAIVRNIDTPVDELDRAKACMIHLLDKTAEQGHTYMSRDTLFDLCKNEFDIGPETTADSLDHLVQEGSVILAIVPETNAALVFPKNLYEAETVTAGRIDAMQSIPFNDTPPDGRLIAEKVSRQLDITLSKKQEEVLHEILVHKVSVITGGPGTGKTTLIRAINTIMERLGLRILLMAPTGRAARRLTDITAKSATTLHKALGYNLADGCFERSENDQLQTDVVIVDEASMVDTLLMAQLIRAVPVKAILILVGDVFQLPSVGPGSVLADLIRSKTIRTFELDEVFRQDKQSLIVTNAHRIRNGQNPRMDPPGNTDTLSEMHFLEKVDPRQVIETVIQLCQQEIPRHFRKCHNKKMDPIRDIQVLTPMHRGPVGTLNLNRRLQEALNPTEEQVTIMGSRFSVGDKVMHLRNNYQKEVFNGDIGIFHSIDMEKESAEVNYDGRIVSYNFLELDELVLAYAISVHKSQGSEYPAVVIPLVTQHYVMLQRNLLYTALTRGKQLVVMVGNPKALDIALKNNRPRERRSLLAYHLNPEAALATCNNELDPTW